MHLTDKAGEKTFIDFSGKTVDIVNPKNGVITKAELFIAVLPASGVVTLITNVTDTILNDPNKLSRSRTIMSVYFMAV